MSNDIQLTDEQKQLAKEVLEDQMTKIGEVMSQCWESEEFKEAFIADPKAIFEEYGIAYDKNKTYKVFQTPDKTMVHVLPYKGVKRSIKNFNDLLLKHVEDIEDDEAKQVLLEDWSWQVYQNTEDVFYVPIPLCPENLTPEELELVNGGCLVLVLVFLFQTEAIATTTSAAVEVEAIFVLAIDAVVGLEIAFGAAVAVLLAEAIVSFTTLLVHVTEAYTVSTETGAYIFVHSAAIDETPTTPRVNTGAAAGVDPRRRGR